MAQTFLDTANRPWRLEISVATVKRVKSMLDLDLLDVEKTLKQIAHPVTLVDLIWVLIESQAQTANVTDLQFAESMGGDSLEQASHALLEALTLFFEGPRRAMLQKALEKAKRVEALAAELADKRLAEFSDDVIKQQLASQLPKLGSFFSNGREPVG